jgi:hypothetical protein
MRTLLYLATLGVLLVALGGCVQMPTGKQAVVDMRPQISFVAEPGHRDARVFLDDAEVGRVGDYLDGAAALRVLPGTHVVRVVSGGGVLLDERFYIADGASRAFVIR